MLNLDFECARANNNYNDNCSWMLVCPCSDGPLWGVFFLVQIEQEREVGNNEVEKEGTTWNDLQSMPAVLGKIK